MRTIRALTYLFLLTLLVALAGCMPEGLASLPVTTAPAAQPSASLPAQFTPGSTATQVVATVFVEPLPTATTVRPTQTRVVAAPTATSTRPRPSATPLATQTTVPASPTPVARRIGVTSPKAGAVVASPLQVSGDVSVWPFEATLVVRVYDAGGQMIGEGPVQVSGEMGRPGNFSGAVPFSAGESGPGRVEIVDLSARDGSVLAGVAVDVALRAPAPAAQIEIPAEGAQVTLPLHILARLGKPGEELSVVLRWRNGAALSDRMTVLRGEDGQGLLIGNLSWQTEGQPPQPADRAATLQIRDGAGTLLAQRQLHVLRWDDSAAMPVKLFWTIGDDEVAATQQRVVRTERIGTAALEALLWGPAPGNLAGFSTALPTPEQVLAYPGRGAGWGPRVRLLSLRIENGVAVADFSRELAAYGGGSLRVKLIRQQITQTLKQFATVQEVRIAIEGRTEAVLEP